MQLALSSSVGESERVRDVANEVSRKGRSGDAPRRVSSGAFKDHAAAVGGNG